MFIGYNIKEAQTLIDKAYQEYENIRIYLPQEWETLLNVLRSNWVGMDELDFEKNFIERINKLYKEAENCVFSFVDRIDVLVNNWYTFQQKNTIDGGNAEGFYSVNHSSGGFMLELPNVKNTDNIINFTPYDLNANMNFGLMFENSAGNIKAAVETFVNSVKERVNGLFATIDGGKAFLGEQSNSLKIYIENIGKSVAVVSTSVKDLYEKLDVLAANKYKTQQEQTIGTFSSEYIQDPSNVSEGSRWS